ncbi:hypothetical protein [Streptomyces anthocyanicus]|uniref:hypothetical protein n=1 Tax=Streptomyces anthocyanicus TaxID=68174 RepID=UPI002F9110F4|nr:hypothetical protein OH747_40495 [Streptomyces anthocyanicus]
MDGLTVAESAAVLGISQLTARVRLHRARRALRGTPKPDPAETALPALSLVEAQCPPHVLSTGRRRPDSG